MVVKENEVNKLLEIYPPEYQEKKFGGNLENVGENGEDCWPPNNHCTNVGNDVPVTLDEMKQKGIMMFTYVDAESDAKLLPGEKITMIIESIFFIITFLIFTQNHNSHPKLQKTQLQSKV